MATGSTIEEELRDAKTMPDVDRIVWKHVKAGHVPAYIAKNYWKLVTVKENGHTLEYLVAPDYFALGTDADPFRIGRESPFLLQMIADHYDSIMPSKKMVDQIEAQANPKFQYQDVKGSPYKIPLSEIDTHAAVVAANNMANKAFDDDGFTVGDGEDSTIGYRKTVVVGPNLDGTRVAIYGGRGAGYKNDRVQPYSTIHGSDPKYVTNPSPHSDYSHGGVLVSRKAKLDGRAVDMRDDVFGSKDPMVWGLVSDQGRFDPVFPNSGKNSLAQFAAPGSDVPAGPKPTAANNAQLAPADSMLTKVLKLGGATAGLIALTWWLLA